MNFCKIGAKLNKKNEMEKISGLFHVYRFKKLSDYFVVSAIWCIFARNFKKDMFP